MTTFAEADAFKKHALWDTVGECIAHWESSKPRDSTDRHTIERAITVLKYLANYRSLPVGLFPSSRESTAVNLNSYADGLIQLWRGWDEEQPMSPATVNAVDQACDNILVILHDTRWPPLQKESRARIFQEAGEAFRTTAEQSIQGIEEHVSQLHVDVSKVTETVSALTDEANMRALEAKTALEEIEQTRLTQAENAQEQLQQELRKANQAAKSQREKHADALTELTGEHNAAASAALEQLQADATRGQALVQLVGDQAQAEGYLKFANKEKNGYRVWVGVGAVSVTLTLVYLAFQFAQLSAADDPSIAVIVMKTALSVSALAFSGFAFREAGKRQRQSLDARYRALDLLALRPFTYGMDEADAKLLRGMLGERLFRSQPDDSAKKTDEKVTTLRLDLGDIKAAADTVKAVRDVSGS